MKLEEIKKLPKEQWRDVAVMGILDSMEEAQTVTGKPYVKGVLADKATFLQWKMWETTLNDLNQRMKNPLQVGCVVSIKGKLNPSPSGELELIVASYVDGGGPGIRCLPHEKVDAFIYQQPFVAETLLRKVQNMTNLRNPQLNEICKRVFANYGKKMLYFPYGTIFHKEKGGALYHIYLAMKQAQALVVPFFDREQMGINLELIITAILVHRLGIYSCYEVDEKTGKIIERNEIVRTLYRQLDNFTEFVLLTRDMSGDEIEALKHMVLISSLPRGIIAPGFKEAEIFLNIINNELNLYSYGEIGEVTPGVVATPAASAFRRKVVGLNLSTDASAEAEVS